MRLAAMVMAAGGSSRMGQPKQVMDINGKPMILHVLEKLTYLDLAFTGCVTGANSQLIAATLPADIRIIQNELWDRGLGTSVAQAIAYVDSIKAIDHVLIVLADQPFINNQDLQRMITLSAQFPGKCIASSYSGSPGVPVIFPRKFFKSLLHLEGDKGAKSFLTNLSMAHLHLYEHHQNLLDLDTPEDVSNI